MTITKDKVGALIFFIFSVSYGYYAYQIPLYPGEEYDVFTSQSMPKLYALVSIIVSALAIILSVINDIKSPSRVSVQATEFNRKGWFQVAALIALMVFYGSTLELLGFISSTILFLILGYIILGERRPKILIVASVPVVIVFWAIMTQLLGIYLTTGYIWS